MVKANAADPNRSLRIGFFGFQSAFYFSAGKPLPVDLNAGFLLKLVEQFLGQRLFQRGVHADFLLCKGDRCDTSEYRKYGHNAFHKCLPHSTVDFVTNL